MDQQTKNICRCCGTSMRNIFDFGTYKDGSIHTEYCFRCYQDGVFTNRGNAQDKKTAGNIELAGKIGRSWSNTKRPIATTFSHLKKWKRGSIVHFDQPE